MSKKLDILFKPLLVFSSILSTVTLLWGLVSIFKDLRDFYGMTVAPYILGFLLAIMLIPAFVILIREVWRRAFSIPVTVTDRYLHLDISRVWAIDQSGNAHILQEKAYVFLKPPVKEDLQDVIFSSQPLNLAEMNHRSTDSRFIDHHEISDGIHRVFWEPKEGSIKVGTPYQHSTEFHAPIDYDPSYKVMTLPFSATTVKFSLSISSEKPIVDICAFKGSRFFRLKNSGRKLARKGKRIKATNAPVPNQISSNNVEWEIHNVVAGDTYFIVIYFDEEFPA